MMNMKNVIISCMYRTPGANVGAFCEFLEHIYLTGINKK